MNSVKDKNTNCVMHNLKRIWTPISPPQWNCRCIIFLTRYHLIEKGWKSYTMYCEGIMQYLRKQYLHGINIIWNNCINKYLLFALTQWSVNKWTHSENNSLIGQKKCSCIYICMPSSSKLDALLFNSDF